MAKRHFDEYYNKVYAQLNSLTEVFDQLSQEVSEGMVTPERLEELNKTIEPIKNNYQTLSYIKYLLNMPNKPSKTPRYKKTNEKLLKACGKYNGEQLIEQHKEIIDNLKH